MLGYVSKLWIFFDRSCFRWLLRVFAQSFRWNVVEINMYIINSCLFYAKSFRVNVQTGFSFVGLDPRIGGWLEFFSFEYDVESWFNLFDVSWVILRVCFSRKFSVNSLSLLVGPNHLSNLLPNLLYKDLFSATRKRTPYYKLFLSKIFSSFYTYIKLKAFVFLFS